MLICHLLEIKSQSAESHQTVLEVASLMVEHNIGAVPVLQGRTPVWEFSRSET